jgi:hypothetical protein
LTTEPDSVYALCMNFMEQPFDERVNYWTGDALTSIGRGDTLRSVIYRIILSERSHAYDLGRADVQQEMKEAKNARKRPKK